MHPRSLAVPQHAAAAPQRAPSPPRSEAATASNHTDASATPPPAAAAATASAPIAISRPLSMVVEEELVVPLTPPRVDPFSLSAAETERQREEVERNQALIYEMLGVRKDAAAAESAHEEPRSPAALLEDLTAALKVEDEEKRAREEESEVRI